MPYITKNTFLNIVKEIDLNQEPYPKKSRLEDKNLTILSKKEMQRLAVISELLKIVDFSPDRFFFKIKKPVDTLTYISPERAPSYHNNMSCPALTKEYENYIIPEDVRILGKDVVNKFRKFFHENRDLLPSRKIEFLYKAKKEFNLKRLPEDISEVRAPNSGRGSIDNFNLETIQEELDDLILEAEDFKNLSPFNRLTINLYGNIFNLSVETGIDDERMKVLKKWLELKSSLKKMYIRYCMVKYNPDIELNGNLLDSIGLNRCSFCYKNEGVIEFI